MIQTTHPDELLAFYINGTLNSFEKHEVKRHIENCAHCRLELELLQTMQDVCKSEQNNPFNSDFAWHRLQRDIKKSSKHNANYANKSKRPWWQPGLATAAAILIAIQGLYIFQLKTNPDVYTQAGLKSSAAVIQIKLNPEATLKQLDAALNHIEAEIISGPAASGLYRIYLTNEADHKDIDTIIARLQENEEVFSYVNLED